MPTIRVVNDDPDTRTILRAVLEREGDRVRTLVDVAHLFDEACECSLVITNYPTPRRVAARSRAGCAPISPPSTCRS